MSKTKNHPKQDAHTTNLLISLLMKFPEVMSIHLDMPHEFVKFTYILRGGPTREEMQCFNRLLDDSIAAFADLTGDSLTAQAKLLRCGKMNLLLITSSTQALTLEGIQLLCGIVCSTFPKAVVRDAETLDSTWDDDMFRHDEIIEFLLSHNGGTKQDNLLAFREAGKVFVYDK